MSTYAMPSVMYGSPRDWDRWVWDSYFTFLEYIHASCPPNGQEDYIDREIARRKLR